MGTSPSWAKSPETWDRIVIAGETFSGPVEVDFTLGRKRDVKSAPGLNGATVTDTGEKPCEVTIRLELWLDEHWDFYSRVLVPLVQPKLPAMPPSSSVSSAERTSSFYVDTPYGPTFADAQLQNILSQQEQDANARRLATSQLTSATGNLVMDPLRQQQAEKRVADARKKALAPVKVYYPSLAAADIRELHLDSLSSPKRVRHGVKEVTLKGTRFTAKKSAAVTTSAAGATDSGLGGIRLAPELTGRPSTTDNKP